MLRDLFFEWTRTAETVEVVSLDAPLEQDAPGNASSNTLYDRLARQDSTPETTVEESDDLKTVQGILEQVDDEKRLILKLLALATVELQPADIRCIARLASRSIRETIALLDEVMASMSDKAGEVEDKRDTLYTTSYWIHTYQRRLTTLAEQICSRHVQDVGKAKIENERAELERKLDLRYRQQAKFRQELQKKQLRPSYADIANLLNLPLGTICSRVARGRQAFSEALVTARNDGA